MAIRGQDLPEDGPEASGEPSSSAAHLDKVVYVLHPNCAIEEV